MNGFPQLTGIVGKQFDAVFASEEPRIRNEPDIEVAFGYMWQSGDKEVKKVLYIFSTQPINSFR
ncbi:hypothetical protein DCD95_11155 [Acinetobacter baumannii]|nr:hypothetical protein CAT66_13765 [Acinetobacter baumannii]PUV08769.1 hypothetical protein DCD95_11155 [Acinetobacter baumannii]